MPYPSRRTILFTLSICIVIIPLWFRPQTLAPNARAQQSPPLFIYLIAPTECGIQVTSEIIIDTYSVDNGEFCITLFNGGGRIVGITSPLVTFGTIPPQGGTICGSVVPGVSALEAARSLVVTFNFGGLGFCVERIKCENTFGNRHDIALLDVLLFKDQLWFTIQNSSESQSAITGVGFDLERNGPFTLDSIIPTPQPGNQNLVFTSDKERVPEAKGAELSFAVTTGHVFAGGNPFLGIQPGETSSQFRVNGNFVGLVGVDIPDGTYVRFAGDITDVQCRYDCPQCGGSLTGIVSGSPR